MWWKMFVDYLPYKGWVSKTYEELLQLNNDNNRSQFKSGQKVWEHICPKNEFNEKKVNILNITNHCENAN